MVSIRGMVQCAPNVSNAITQVAEFGYSFFPTLVCTDTPSYQEIWVLHE